MCLTFLFLLSGIFDSKQPVQPCYIGTGWSHTFRWVDSTLLAINLINLTDIRSITSNTLQLSGIIKLLDVRLGWSTISRSHSCQFFYDSLVPGNLWMGNSQHTMKHRFWHTHKHTHAHTRYCPDSPLWTCVTLDTKLMFPQHIKAATARWRACPWISSSSRRIIWRGTSATRGRSPHRPATRWWCGLCSRTPFYSAGSRCWCTIRYNCSVE